MSTVASAKVDQRDAVEQESRPRYHSTPFGLRPHSAHGLRPILRHTSVIGGSRMVP